MIHASHNVKRAAFQDITLRVSVKSINFARVLLWQVHFDPLREFFFVERDTIMSSTGVRKHTFSIGYIYGNQVIYHCIEFSQILFT